MRKIKSKMQILFTTLAATAAMVLSGCSETLPDTPVTPEPPIETPATIAISPYQGEKGTIIPSALVAEVGADISFTITLAGDYDLFGLKVNGEDLKIEDLAYDPVTDAYTWNTTVAEAGFLFEPDFIEEAAVIDANDEAVVIDGTYDRYWIKSQGNWALGQADLTKSTLMLDFEDGNGDGLFTLPEWNRVVGEVITLNDAIYAFTPVGTSSFQISLPLKISGNYELGSRGRFNLAGLPEGVEAYEVENATFTFNEAVTSGGALFVGADAKLALSNVTLVNGVDETGNKIKALESYTNFGDLSNLSISASDLNLPLVLTHVGKVEVKDSSLGPVVINQGVVGNYFSFTNNNFGGVDKKVSPITLSKTADVHMVGTSHIEGNKWNANEVNVVNGDGLSYETMFTSTELVFSEDVVVKDGLWGSPTI